MKRIGIRGRRALGITSLIAGIVLAAAAVVLIDPARAPIGDVERVESGLRGQEAPPPPGPQPGPPVDEGESTPTDRPSPTPLWQPNPRSLLIEASQTGPAPVRLRIARISVDAPVGEYGIDRETGQMEVPNNLSEVGWYRFGPKPGEPGSAVLAAHVDLQGYGPGVFFDLDLLEPGDRIEIGYADDTKRLFEVEARATYPKDELPLDVIFSRDGPPALTLVTCGGDFNSAISSYDSNVVVYARPVVGVSPVEGSPS